MQRECTPRKLELTVSGDLFSDYVCCGCAHTLLPPYLSCTHVEKEVNRPHRILTSRVGTFHLLRIVTSDSSRAVQPAHFQPSHPETSSMCLNHAQSQELVLISDSKSFRLNLNTNIQSGRGRTALFEAVLRIRHNRSPKDVDNGVDIIKYLSGLAYPGNELDVNVPKHKVCNRTALIMASYTATPGWLFQWLNTLR